MRHPTSGMVALAVLALRVVSTTALGAEDAGNAGYLVGQILSTEIDGSRENRAALLNSLPRGEEYPDKLRWICGYVRESDEWVRFDKRAHDAVDDPRLKAYRAARASGRYGDTPAAQTELANWCRENGLDAQGRAHLHRAIQLDPDFAAARLQLGQQFVDGHWLSPEELQQSREQAARARAAMAKWRDELLEIGRGLSSSSRHVREAARARLLQVRDPDAVGPMIGILAGRSEIESKVIIAPGAAGRIEYHHAPWQKIQQEVQQWQKVEKKTRAWQMRSRVVQAWQIRGQGGIPSIPVPGTPAVGAGTVHQSGIQAWQRSQAIKSEPQPEGPDVAREEPANTEPGPPEPTGVDDSRLRRVAWGWPCSCTAAITR